MIGAMSGTSADGVDVALVWIEGRGRQMRPQVRGHYHHPYDDALQRAIARVRGSTPMRWEELAPLAREIGLAYAHAVEALLAAAKVEAGQIAAIAAHGQTLFHAPPCTVQWLDPALLAARTHIAVVSDFRRADCAAGGQGAPLVPFADAILFAHPDQRRLLLNLGGIANITFLPAGNAFDGLVAFDTGPANCLSDWLVRHGSAGLAIDQFGMLADSGIAHEPIVKHMLAAPYFRQRPPKSTDCPAMVELFLHACDPALMSLPDALATACLITARSVVCALRQFLPTMPNEVIASGGGVHNACLMRLLRQELSREETPAHPPIELRTSQELGIGAEAKEALAFALLGAATLDNEPANVPAATGASRPVVLGSITPKP